VLLSFACPAPRTPTQSTYTTLCRAVMTAVTLAEFQYYGAALEGTSRRPLALGCSASRTPAQSTAVLHRRGRISSGSQSAREPVLRIALNDWNKPRPTLPG